MLVTLATWLVTGSPLVAVLHYRSASRSLARIEALQQANTAASERPMAEALTEVERYQLLARMVPAGILRFDWRGRALFANAQCRLVSQADATALPPWRWLRAIDREDRRKVHQDRRTLDSVDATLEGEVRFRPPGGPERWVQFSLVRESDETFLLAFVDRTRDKLVERHLEQRLRIDAVTGMAGRIARDLRSSLTPAALGADALAREVGDDHPGLRAVRSGVKDATRIVRQLVSLIEDSGGPGEVLDLAELMRPVEDSLRSTAPKPVHVLLVTPAAPVTIAGHAAQVSQAVLILGCNAVEAMPGGGTLTLRLEQRSIDDSYARTIPGGRPGAFAIVTVAIPAWAWRRKPRPGSLSPSSRPRPQPGTPASGSPRLPGPWPSTEVSGTAAPPPGRAPNSASISCSPKPRPRRSPPPHRRSPPLPARRATS
jgi:signal transduction histidine kinase